MFEFQHAIFRTETAFPCDPKKGTDLITVTLEMSHAPFTIYTHPWSRIMIDSIFGLSLLSHNYWEKMYYYQITVFIHDRKFILHVNMKGTLKNIYKPTQEFFNNYNSKVWIFNIFFPNFRGFLRYRIFIIFYHISKYLLYQLKSEL